MEDNQIVDLYFERKETAISQTAIKYGRYCFSISYGIVRNQDDADECVNDTYLAAWNSIPPNRPSMLSTYLAKIVRNISINRYKSYRTQKRGLGQVEIALSELENCIPSGSNVEESLDKEILTNTLNKFLYGSEEKKRNIFIRRYWYLQSIDEIAEDFGVSTSKIASILFRMRKKLKVYLEKEGIII